MNDHEVEVSGWAAQWITRTYRPLYLETTVANYAITGAALVISLKLLWDIKRTVRTLNENPTDRTAILAEGDKRAKKALRKQRGLSWMLLLHSQALWLVDAGIGIFAIYSDASENPSSYDSTTWINMAIYSLGLFVLFTSVLLLFPMFQFVLLGKFMRFFQPNVTSLAELVPGALVLSHQLAYLWLFVGFTMVSWWSVLDYSLLRVVCLEAVFGSGLAWMHASSMLNHTIDELKELDIQSMTLKDGMRLYGKQVHAIYVSRPNQDVLPTYEAVPQIERVVDEKASLL